MLLCPVCAHELELGERMARCPAGHTFDRAREGYFNLLRSSKSGDRTGDPKAAARSRRDFLDRGYYQILRDGLVDLVDELAGASPCAGGRSAAGRSVSERPAACPTAKVPDTTKLLDICCGEGYYTSALGGIEGVEAYGFDLSKEMVRLAAKRGGAVYFVANMKAVPVADSSFDIATHLFAPFMEHEFARVLAPGGALITVIPGARHLLGLKEAVYDTPYLNDEKLPVTTQLVLEGSRKLAGSVVLETAEDIEAVFQMTPYYYRTSERDRAKLAGRTMLETPVEFVIGIYRKPLAAARP